MLVFIDLFESGVGVDDEEGETGGMSTLPF